MITTATTNTMDEIGIVLFVNFALIVIVRQRRCAVTWTARAQRVSYRADGTTLWVRCLE
jgi:hypothetical protein